MAFIETRIPDEIAGNFRSRTEIPKRVVRSRGGFVSINQTRSRPKKFYTCNYNERDIEELEELKQLYFQSRGGFDGVRFKDWDDFSTARHMTIPVSPFDTFPDPIIDPSNPSRTARWQLVKRYGNITREITKIVPNTFQVAGRITAGASGNTAENVLNDVDLNTGIMTFSFPIDVVRQGSNNFTCGFEFDVPVFFVGNYLDVDIPNFFEYESVLNVRLEELFL